MEPDILETHLKMALHEYAGFISEHRNNGMSCGDIATALCTQFGTTRGFSERNVRRWCAEQGLVRDFCPDSQLEVEVAEGILEVGFFLSSTFHDYRFC